MIQGQDKQFLQSSDRGMSLTQWQEWIVDLLIKKHDEGLSDNQLRFLFVAEFNRRYGYKGVSNDPNMFNTAYKPDKELSRQLLASVHPRPRLEVVDNE